MSAAPLTKRKVNLLYTRKTGLVLLTFFSIYAVNFSFLPTFTQRLMSFVFLLAFFLVISLKNPRWKNDHNFHAIVFLIFGVLIYSVLSSALTGFKDTSQIISLLVLIAQVGVASFGIAWMLVRNDFNFHDLIYLIVVVIALQAVLIAIQFSVAPFREWVATHIPIGGNFDVDPVHRGRGLYHAPSATLAVVQSIGLYFCFYLLYVGPHGATHRRFKSTILLLAAVALLISIFLTGRTGFMVLPFILLYLFLSIIQRGTFKTPHVVLFLGGVCVVTVGFVLLSWFYEAFGAQYTELGEDGLSNTLRWVSREFTGTTNEPPFRTVRILMERHVKFPDNAVTLLVGDARTWAYNRVPSDIGYIRRLFTFGIIGSVLYYGTLVALFGYIIKRQDSRELRGALTVLALYLFFVETKEPFLTHNLVASVYMIVFFFSYFGVNSMHRPHSNRP